jgi:hypothetical protein
MAFVDLSCSFSAVRSSVGLGDVASGAGAVGFAAV